VFIEASVLLVAEPADDRRQQPSFMLAPGAADAVALLSEGHEVQVVEPPDGDGATLAGLTAVASVPVDFPHGSWFITADETWCEGDRPNGLRSILVTLAHARLCRLPTNWGSGSHFSSPSIPSPRPAAGRAADRYLQCSTGGL
jgi:hypothetical protein